MAGFTRTEIDGCDPNRLRLVCEAHGIRLLVLFGSRAPGGLEPRPDSDLDLALLPGPSDFSIRDCFHGLADACPGQSIDLLSLRGVDPLVRWEAMRDGQLLYGDVDDFLEYRAFAFRDYVDSAGLRELEAILFRKKVGYLRSESRAAP